MPGNLNSCDRTYYIKQNDFFEELVGGSTFIYPRSCLSVDYCQARVFLDYFGFSYDVIEVNSVLRQQVGLATTKFL